MKLLAAIDLCGGAGGWAVAARGLPIRVLCAVDLWHEACETYRLNHPDVDVLSADLRDPETQDMLRERFAGKLDLVLGGIPCEWLTRFRNINPVKGDELAKQRATLDAVLQLVSELVPRWWCLEDVPQVQAELPAFTPSLVIDSAGYSAQRRSRCYIGRFPAPAEGRAEALCREYLRPGPYRLGPRLAKRRLSRGHTFEQRTARPFEPNRKSPTIIDASSRHDAEYGVLDLGLPGGMRQVEWQEAARLQGFPETYVFYGNPTAVGKMVGQAIQIDTGRAILDAIVAEAAKGEPSDESRNPALECVLDVAQ